MRVLQVTPKFFPSIGGVETHVFELSKHISLLGVEVDILTTDIISYKTMQRVRISSNDSIIRARGFKILPLPEGVGIIAPSMLRYITCNYDIVHLHSYGSFPTFLAPLFSIGERKVVITTHSDEGLPSIRKRIFDIVAPRFSLDHASKVIAVSEHERRVLLKLGVEEQKIEVIPNGVDPELLKISRKSEHGRKVLYVGRVNFRQKGLDILLLAIRKLVDRLQGFELEIAGPPDEIDILNSYSRKLGIEGIVRYYGTVPRKKLIDLMKHADLLVLPSRFEPFGIVVLEAMAIGLPVVAAKVGGVPEVLREKVDGLLFPPEDIESLALNIEELLTDTRMAEKLASNAKERASSFTWDKIALRLMALYKQLC